MDRVSEDMPLYDILNEFQKGHSHMAVVVKYNMEKSEKLKLDRRKTAQKPTSPKDLQKNTRSKKLSLFASTNFNAKFSKS